MKKLIGIIYILVVLCSCESKKIEVNFNDKKQKMDKLPFSESNNFSKEYLINNFWKCHYDIAGENLKYYVTLPKDVKTTAIEPKIIRETGLTNIGVYSRVESKAPYMEVWVYYENIEQSVQPADWVKQKLKTVGQTIINQKEITSPQGNRYIDVLSQKGEIITRTTEYVNGKGDYIMLSVVCDSKDYSFLAETIQHIVSSWGLE